jgi:DNA helicase-2/ATP-dependent DNA helicase PcrA
LTTFDIVRIFYAAMPQESFGRLSKAQQEAVEYLDGPQIILAGAGSGKTRVIVAKTQFLIEQKSYAPDSILVITYSTKTQAELEERLGSAMPGLSIGDDSSLQIKTFHALGMDLISEFGHHLRLSSEIAKVSEHRLWQYLKRAIGELLESDLLDTNQPEKVYGDIKAFISRAKDELLLPDEIIARAEAELSRIPIEENDDAIILREKWAKALEAGHIYKSYERIKSEDVQHGGIDYGDMILLSHRLLSNSRVTAATIRKRMRFILVDEFQDANFAQVEILRLLVGPSCGVTVVGDDDQAIYRFRGASFASFKLFQKLFPGWRAFKLEENFRSQANIIAAAQSLIEIDPGARFDAGKKMTPVRPGGSKVYIRKCPDDFSEASSVACEIEKLLKDGEHKKPKSIAILVRARRHKDILIKTLERKGIPYFYDKRVSEIKSKAAKILLFLYEFTGDPTRADLLTPIISHFLPGIRPEIERELNYRLGREAGNLLETLAKSADELKSASLAGVSGLVELLNRLIELSRKHEPLQLLERIISEAGIMRSVIAGGRIDDYEALEEIASILKIAEKFQEEYPNSIHADFLEYLSWHSSFGGENEHDIDTDSPLIIQTVHGAKGLEYPAVFMISLSNAKFPPRKQYAIIEFPPELYKEDLPPGDYRMQEERRLFYVGMTRARQTLYLYGTEKKGTKISQFVSELEKSPAFKDVAVTEKLEPAETFTVDKIGPLEALHDPTAAIIIAGNKSAADVAAQSMLELWRKKSAGSSSPEEFELLKDDFLREIDAGLIELRKAIAGDKFTPKEPPQRIQFDTLSYTDLEAFRNCPLQFYFAKALRMPSPPNPNAALGSVIHKVLQGAGQAFKDNRELKLEELQASFEMQWAGVSLPDPDRKERLRARGHDLLERFVRMQSHRSGKPVELEKKFSEPLFDNGRESGPKIIGRIDRIDSTSDGFEVIDYKTGKQSSADLKHDLQLPLYALACKSLLGQYPSRLTYMFLGDDTQYDREFNPDIIKSMKEEIGAVIEQINSSDFVATPGQPCRTCNFARICPAKAEG